MLYQAALILALAGGALCENNHYEDEDIDLLQTFGQSLVWEQNTDELWSLEETVIYDEAVEQEGGCCLPDELQCFMGMMIAFQHRGSKLMMGFINYYMDAKQGKAFLDANVTLNGHNMHVTVWQDLNQMMQYTIVSGFGDRCFKTKMTYTKWTSKCIPAGTQKLGDVYFGNRNGDNRINSTWYKFDDKKGTAAYVSFTDTANPNECIPVTLAGYGMYKLPGMKRGRKVPYTVAIDFMNIVPEVKNDEVFKIPAACLKADVSTMSMEKSFLGNILLF